MQTIQGDQHEEQQQLQSLAQAHPPPATTMSSSSPINPLYTYTRASLLLFPWLTHLLISDLLLSLLLPISTLFPTLAYHASSSIAYSVWLGIQTLFTTANHAHITVSGLDALPPHESAIVIANHVQWSDFYMIQALALEAGMLGRCRWFAKQQLRWVPFLGWGLWAMGMPLVSRKWTEDRREMQRVFHGVLQRHWPMWLISYSEATRYTPAKRLEAEAWCQQHSRTLGKHVLYPRTKGFVASVQQLRAAPHMKAVYDMTIAYARRKQQQGVGGKSAWEFQSAPTFGQTVLDPRLDERWRFYVHVERYGLESLPKEEAELAAWLEQRWVEKGERLEELRVKLEEGLPWE